MPSSIASSPKAPIPNLGRSSSSRARHLLDPRSRRALATALEAIVEEAHSHHRASSAKGRVRRDQVTQAEPVIGALVRRLRSERTVNPQGLALVRRLIVDPGGPLYAPRRLDELDRVVRAALQALEPDRAL